MCIWAWHLNMYVTSQTEHLHDTGQITISYVALIDQYETNFAFPGSAVWNSLPSKMKTYKYKIATLAYLHFEESLLPYLSSSLCIYEPSRSLRSCKEKLLKIPKRNLRSFRELSFSFMAPSTWNSLPANPRNLPTLSQFKSNLKTFLFAQAFPQI